MKVYVIMVENLVTGNRKVSGEAYSTINKAQNFCMERSGKVVKHNDWLFYDGIYRYEIVEASVI